MARIRKSSSIVFNSLTLEGSLIAPAMLERIAARDAGQQSEEHYGIPKGLTIRDEMARYFRIGQALFLDFDKAKTPSTAATVSFIEDLLRDVFAFSDIKRTTSRTLDDRIYTVTLEALEGRAPVIVVPPSDALDRASDHLPSDGRKRSAATAIQDWLNAYDEALWGFCTNGEKLRLVRDNASLTRPAYIEADLRQIFESENFADFAALWLLINASRFGLKDSPVSDCALERWKETGSKEGVAARDRLRDGVEASLLTLGNGFLAHPKNAGLRERIQKGDLQLQDYFTQLLRLVYRLIFMLAAEDRNLLHSPNATIAARKLYLEGYSLDHLRKQAVRRAAWDRHHDKWEGLLIVFAALAKGEPILGLPALGGLFNSDDLSDLEQACLSNKVLMEAIYRLAWLKEDSRLTPINWRDMETEELGSVYESLLELTPRLIDNGRSFGFAEGTETKGNARKTTGSYYTPDSLVQALLDSALDPVLDRAEVESEDPIQGLLSLTVIDPACGSGHFLLAAARRIASRVARLRAGGVASAEDYRHALRDAVRNCIYGVDRNPMAVELTKVALWIETVEPGKPLGFLDANIRCGDALLGVFDLESLREGVPDAAYKPLTGDDKDTAKYYAQRNKSEKAGQGELGLLGDKSQLPPPPPLAKTTKMLRSLPEDSVKDIAEKKQKFEASLSDPIRWKWRLAADMYVAAFLARKVGGEPSSRGAATIPSTAHVWEQLSGGQSHEPLARKIQNLTRNACAFHWPLEFPDIMERGGFDVMLGNPPWERVKLQEKEFFASRDPEIAEAANAAARRRLIAELENADQGSRKRNLFEEFEEAKRLAEAASLFARESGRYPLTGRGDVNTYPLFAEHFTKSINQRGRAGIIVPTGLITDYSTSIFFASLVSENKLIQSLAFDNQKKIFPGIHSDTPFTLLTLGKSEGNSEFAAYLLLKEHMDDRRRRYKLTGKQIERINPNTKTAPVFRTRADAELTAKIYDKIPVLIDNGKSLKGNPWNVSFLRLFDMSNDSELFETEPSDRCIPLYEAKMIHQYDHRWCTFLEENSHDCPINSKQDPSFEVLPRYWVPETEVAKRLSDKNWSRQWLMGIRGITNATNERTIVGSIWPYAGAGNSCHVWVVDQKFSARQITALYGNLCSLTLDFIARQKVGGTNLNFFYVEQFPFLEPSVYSEEDLDFIVSRVLELTYTSHSMKPLAHDLGYDGAPFSWNEDRRALLRAELDAWYANAYGLTRDELRYILDPVDIMGADYPSETFRVLKEREIKEYGEYRTGRLVLEAWDRMYGEATQPAHINMPVSPAILANNSWMTPSGVLPENIALFAAMDAMRTLGQNIPEQTVRLAALMARKPALAMPFMDDAQKSEWQRLIGAEVQPLAQNVIAIADFQNQQSADHAWGSAIQQLQGSGAIISQNGHWSAGSRLTASGQDWMEGRMNEIVKILNTVDDIQAAYNKVVIFLREVHNGTARRAVS